jgi:hypothetical protein
VGGAEALWSIPQRSPYSLVQELEFIAARRRIFLQLAAEWTRLKTGKLPANVQELIEEYSGQSFSDPDVNRVDLLERGVAMHPILKIAEDYEQSLISPNIQMNPGRNVLVDPVTNQTFEIDFTQGSDPPTPEE